jgi:ubiquinone/menaquinone biosynthesis C-methylase UbiE
MKRINLGTTMTAARKDLVGHVGTTAFFKRISNKYWYPLVTRRLNSEDVVFLNYGYEEDPPMAVPLSPSDERNRYCIQHYHRTATQADVTGKKVLEVSCGHGGGASYLMRTLRPDSYTALDFNADGIAFCRRRHDLPGLDFVHGDAESLPFDDESFDSVLNVEASHAYPRFWRFLSEVARVLRPEGHFLYADFRGREQFSEWDQALADAPMRMLSEREINEEVLRAMERNAQQSLELIERNLPAVLRPYGRLFAGVPGSKIFRDLERGEISYRMYCFTKD